MKRSNFVIKGVGICAAEISEGAAGDGADAGAVVHAFAEAAAAGHAGGNDAITVVRIKRGQC